MWQAVQVRYKPAYLKDQKNKLFKFDLTCSATRFFQSKSTKGGDGVSYAEPLRELFEQIKKLNATFIREHSGLVLAGIFQLVLRVVRYIPLAGRCHRELRLYLHAKMAIINIQNTDDRCFGYALLWFIDPPRDRRHIQLLLQYTEAMFERNNLVDLFHPIPPNDLHLYENQLQININVFFSTTNTKLSTGFYQYITVPQNSKFAIMG